MNRVSRSQFTKKPLTNSNISKNRFKSSLSNQSINSPNSQQNTKNSNRNPKLKNSRYQQNQIQNSQIAGSKIKGDQKKYSEEFKSEKISGGFFSEEGMHQQKLGYKWGCINYRDAKYHGKILQTTYKNNRNTGRYNLNYVHNNLIASSFTNTITQYRDGPGILMLDNNTWIIAKWHKNKLLSTNTKDQTNGNKIYIITNQLNIIELCLRNSEKADVQNISQEHFWQEQFIKSIQQLSYAGSFFADEREQQNKNDQRNQTHEKCLNRYSRYTITGNREYNNNDRYDTWKWVIDHPMQISNDGRDSNIYCLQTQHYHGDHQQIKIKSNCNLQENPQNDNIKYSQESHENCINNYQYFINNMKEILSNKIDNNERQITFCSQQNQQNQQIQYKIIQNKKNDNVDSKNKKIYTIVISTFCNEQTYIKISQQQETNDLKNSQTKKSNPFLIQQLGTLTKSSVLTTNDEEKQNNSIVIYQQDKYLYSLKYLYSIKPVGISLSNVWKRYGITLQPQLQIQEYFNDGNQSRTLNYRYRHSCHNISHYKDNNSQQYKTSQHLKKIQHLSSINFVDKTHVKLAQNINKLLQIICTLQNQIKILDRKNNKKQVNILEKEEIKKKKGKRTQRKLMEIEDCQRYVKDIVEKIVKRNQNRKLESNHFPEKKKKKKEQQQQKQTKQLDSEICTLQELTQKYQIINRNLVLSAKKNHIPLSLLKEVNRKQTIQKQPNQQQQSSSQASIQQEDDQKQKQLRQQQQQAQLILKQRQKIIKRNKMKSYNEYDVLYWQQDYKNENKLKNKIGKRKISHNNEIKRINFNPSVKSIYTEYMKDNNWWPSQQT